MAGAFFLLRGAEMKEEWLTPWKKAYGKISMPGNTSCSQNLRVAIGFAIPTEPKANFTSVLFVISCRNYTSPKGIRMNN